MFKGLEEFTKYTKSQRRAIYVILSFIAVLQVGLYFSNDIFLQENTPVQVSKEVAAFFAEDAESKKDETKQISLFTFNPNTASADDLLRLGMAVSSAERLVKYRDKGGVFRKPEDLFKLYGVDSSWVQKVITYVNIPNKNQEGDSKAEAPRLNLSFFDPNTVSVYELTSMGVKEWQAKRIITYREKVKPFKVKEDFYKLYGFDSATVWQFLPFVKIEEIAVVEEKIVPVDINAADSLTLINIRGVGSYTAKNILKYKERLGGFVSVDQLKEVYGLKPDRLEQISPYFKVDVSKVEKLNINTATFKELLRHPYLEYEMVKSIVNFRENTRVFQSVDEIQYLEGMSDEVFKKVKPYLEAE